MKIGKLNMHCGNCKIIDCCDEPFSEICICKDSRFEDIEEEKFEELYDKSKRKSKKAIINDVYKMLKQ
jgi:hypothetical protein